MRSCPMFESLLGPKLEDPIFQIPTKRENVMEEKYFQVNPTRWAHDSYVEGIASSRLTMSLSEMWSAKPCPWCVTPRMRIKRRSTCVKALPELENHKQSPALSELFYRWVVVFHHSIQKRIDAHPLANNDTIGLYWSISDHHIVGDCEEKGENTHLLSVQWWLQWDRSTIDRCLFT